MQEGGRRERVERKRGKEGDYCLEEGAGVRGGGCKKGMGIEYKGGGRLDFM